MTKTIKQRWMSSTTETIKKRPDGFRDELSIYIYTHIHTHLCIYTCYIFYDTDYTSYELYYTIIYYIML